MLHASPPAPVSKIGSQGGSLRGAPYADRWTRLPVLDWLLEEGADYKIPDEDGVTPYMAAARASNVEAVFRFVNRTCRYDKTVQWQAAPHIVPLTPEQLNAKVCVCVWRNRCFAGSRKPQLSLCRSRTSRMATATPCSGMRSSIRCVGLGCSSSVNRSRRVEEERDGQKRVRYGPDGSNLRRPLQNPVLVHYLISAGANPNIQCYKERTVTMLAIRIKSRGNIALCVAPAPGRERNLFPLTLEPLRSFQLLLKANVDMSLKDKRGNTAADYGNVPLVVWLAVHQPTNGPAGFLCPFFPRALSYLLHLARSFWRPQRS